jgi:hypothetical protein
MLLHVFLIFSCSGVDDLRITVFLLADPRFPIMDQSDMCITLDLGIKARLTIVRGARKFLWSLQLLKGFGGSDLARPLMIEDACLKPMSVCTAKYVILARKLEGSQLITAVTHVVCPASKILFFVGDGACK